MADKVAKETNPENMTEMSRNLTREMNKMDEGDMVLADRKEGDLGPVYFSIENRA